MCMLCVMRYYYVTKRYCAAVVIIILVHLKTRVTIRGVIHCYTVFFFFWGRLGFTLTVATQKTQKGELN